MDTISNKYVVHMCHCFWDLMFGIFLRHCVMQFCLAISCSDVERLVQTPAFVARVSADCPVWLSTIYLKPNVVYIQFQYNIIYLMFCIVAGCILCRDSTPVIYV